MSGISYPLRTQARELDEIRDAVMREAQFQRAMKRAIEAGAKRRRDREEKQTAGKSKDF